ncbi:hypothetical protein ACFLSQ_01920 [Bacteroidota bacterium]
MVFILFQIDWRRKKERPKDGKRFYRRERGEKTRRNTKKFCHRFTD